MSYTQENPGATSAQPASASDPPRTSPRISDVGAHERAGDSRPRIVQEHHVTGPRGEDEIEAIDDRGRRWYHLRPEPRSRADVMGFNYTWWTVLWILVIVSLIFPWW
jgi:hypothetical protein